MTDTYTPKQYAEDVRQILKSTVEVAKAVAGEELSDLDGVPGEDLVKQLEPCMRAYQTLVCTIEQLRELAVVADWNAGITKTDPEPRFLKP